MNIAQDIEYYYDTVFVHCSWFGEDPLVKVARRCCNDSRAVFLSVKGEAFFVSQESLPENSVPCLSNGVHCLVFAGSCS